MPLLLTCRGGNMGQCGRIGPAGNVEVVVWGRKQTSLWMGETGGLLFLPLPFLLLIEKGLESSNAE